METVATFANDLAHNFETLFRSATEHLQRSQEEGAGQSVAQDYVAQALHELREIEEGMEALFTLSQDKGAGEREHVKLVSLVQGVLDLVEPSFPEALTLRTQFDGRGPVRGRPAQLRQVVMNLLANAKQAMEERWAEQPTVLDVRAGEIRVDPDLAEQYLNLEPGPYAYVAVSDTGCGMEAETQERMFEPFFTTKEDGDTGLGLSIVRDIVEAHDGTLTVQSEPGEGTTVTVYLPLVPEAAQWPSRASVSPAPETERHVLVVDDEGGVELENVRLPRLGYDVTTEGDGEQALETVKERPEAFDVVLVDYQLPDMNGLEVVHALRRDGYEIPTVLMTELSAQVSETKARVAGADRFLKKPIASSELNELLAHV